MKADQINRLMRVNARKNLWLLRNTNQLYENAVRTYYQRSVSLLPYNPASAQNIKIREENRAPVRSLAAQREKHSSSGYPRNHKQMADHASCATSAQLLNTVIQANRQRSMSFSAGGLRMYGKQILNGRRDDVLKGRTPIFDNLERPEGRMVLSKHLDLDTIGGRSMSLPPRTSIELGMGYALGKGKGPPSCKQHFNAIEKTMSANAASAARRRQRTKYDSDTEKLMIVDEALKQRLAVRFDRQPDDESGAGRFRFGGYGTTGIIDRRSYSLRGENPSSITKEQTRFHTLGERIRQFEVIQFADGPVTFQAFNRNHNYGSGRVQQMGGKHLPKQQPCLSFHNVLHTNHRQRSLSIQTRSQSLEASPELGLEPNQTAPLAMMEMSNEASSRNATPPLGQLGQDGQLGPQAPGWRPQQQQQQQQKQKQQQKQQIHQKLLKQQHQANIEDILGPRIHVEPSLNSNSLSEQSKIKRKGTKTVGKLRNFKSKKPVKQAGSNRSLKQSTNKNKAVILKLAKETAHQKADDHEEFANMTSTRSLDHIDREATLTNKLSRTSHLSFMKGAMGPEDLPRLAEKLKEEKQSVKTPRRMQAELPKQPQTVKGAHHLLTASATQVSAYKRAFKNRQQILQAEMLHIHAQQLPKQQKMQKQQTPQLPPIQQQPQHVQEQQQHPHLAQQQTPGKPPTSRKPLAGVASEEIRFVRKPQTTTSKTHERHEPLESSQSQTPPTPSPLAAAQQRLCTQRQASGEMTAEMAIKRQQKAAPHPIPKFPAISEKIISSNFQRQQQQQLQQQLHQRRQQPFESLWRRNH